MNPVPAMTSPLLSCLSSASRRTRAALRAAPLALVALLAAAPARAGDNPGADLIFDLGAAVLVKPKFEGAREALISPTPLFKLKYLRLPGLFTIGGGPDTGLSLWPAFNIVGKRDAAGTPYLRGLGDVDTAFELGVGASYTHGFVRGMAEVRRGFGGHEGVVGVIGVDAIVKPVDRLTLEVGPRVTFADGEYMKTYFGVTAAQAAASGYRQFDARAGIKSIGIDSKMVYEFNDTWRGQLEAGYARLVGDAGKSPITARGSRDQYSLRIGATYRFALDLFD